MRGSMGDIRANASGNRESCGVRFCNHTFPFFFKKYDEGDAVPESTGPAANFRGAIEHPGRRFRNSSECHNTLFPCARRINPKGESVRKRKASLTEKEEPI